MAEVSLYPARTRGAAAASNRRWMLDACLWWSVTGACLAAAQLAPLWLLPLAWCALGIAQHAIGTLAHEGLHRHIHNNRRINETLTCCCAWPLGLSASRWRRWHFEHHAHLGTARDPEQPLKLAHPANWRRRPATQALRDALGLSFMEMVELWLVVNRGIAVRAGAIQGSVFGLIVLAGGWRIVAMWIIALLTSQVVVFRLRAKTEHDIGQRGTKVTHQPSLLARATFLPCLTWRHYEHHRWPGVRYSEFRAQREFSV